MVTFALKVLYGTTENAIEGLIKLWLNGTLNKLHFTRFLTLLTYHPVKAKVANFWLSHISFKFAQIFRVFNLFGSLYRKMKQANKAGK